MTTWILIVYLTYGYSGAAMNVTFHSKQSCELAMAALKKEADWSMCLEDKHDQSQ